MTDDDDDTVVVDGEVVLTGDDLAQLERVLGSGWIERLVDDDTHRDAVVELAETIDALGSHYRRADGEGCVCGWDGDDMVDHLRRQAFTDDEDIRFPLAIDRDRTRPPGDILRKWAAIGRRSDGDAARACGLPVATYRGILSGSEVITDDIARRLEIGTETYAKNIWLMLERDYRAALIEQARSRYSS